MKRVLIIIVLISVLTVSSSCSSDHNNLSNNVPNNDPSDSLSNDNNSSNSVTNSQTLKDLQKKGLEIIEDQSFWIEFKNWGKVKFVSGKLLTDGKFKLYLYLTDNSGKILYEFPNFYGNNWPMFSEIKAVSFKDVNKDGMKDIIIISEYMTGVGPNGAIPFPVGSIYFQRDKDFINIHNLDEQINDTKKNENIDMILKFVEGKDINF